MKVENVERKLLRVDEVAARLDCNPETVRRKIHRGELPALRIGGGDRAPIRVDPAAFEAWLSSCRASRKAVS
jgi:excisionase family DNA binding protein